MNLILRNERIPDIFFNPFPGEEDHYRYTVPTDIKEDDDSYTLSADLPGMKEKDIKVEYDNGILMISGERKSEKKEENKNFFKSEICYGKFSRSFRFGDSIQEDKIKAKFQNGVLNITLPKKEAKKPKLIPLH